MPSDSRIQCNSTIVKAMGLIFLLLDVTERCLLPYHCTYNAFFMDLLQPSHDKSSFKLLLIRTAA